VNSGIKKRIPEKGTPPAGKSPEGGVRINIYPENGDTLFMNGFLNRVQINTGNDPV
jgi:hypothetical protein